jgi:hypothetical protein
MRLQSIRTRTLLVIPVRVGLGIVWLAAAHFAGVEFGVLAFALGAGGVTFAALTDRRRQLLQGDVEPLPAPDDARLDPAWRHVLSASFPSTVGVSVLAAIAVVPAPALAALLGGVSAGLGLVALLALPRVDPALLVDPGNGVLYRTTIPPCSPGS